MHTGMDYLYRREAGFYPFKICETTSDSYLSFKDLQVASVRCLLILDVSVNWECEAQIDIMYIFMFII